MEHSNWPNPKRFELILNLIKKLNVNNLAKFIVLGQNDSDPNQLDLLLLTNDRQVFAFGPNSHGRLGVGHCNPVQRQAIEIPELSKYNIVDIVCGGEHVFALTKRGRLFAWGDNQHGKLGLGLSKKSVQEPTLVRSNESFKSIKCGLNHSLALTQSGQIYQWGDCGLKKMDVPTLVSNLEKKTMTAIDCGKLHSIALTKDGFAYTWGDNKWGQLGIGQQSENKSEPFPVKVKVKDSIFIKSIAAGHSHSLFLNGLGQIFVCGRNNLGQLGCNLSARFLLIPQIISGTNHFESIQANHNLSVGLSLDDKHCYCWGQMFNEQETDKESETNSDTTLQEKSYFSIEQTIIMFASFESATNLVEFEQLQIQWNAPTSVSSSTDSETFFSSFYLVNSFEELFKESLELSKSLNPIENAKTKHCGFKTTELSIPQTFKEATETSFDSLHWKDAIRNELVTLFQHEVIDKELLTEVNPTAKVFNFRCLFGLFDDQDNYIDRFVAQFVIEDSNKRTRTMNKLILPKIIFPTFLITLVWALKKSLSVKKISILTTFKECSLTDDGYQSDSDIYLRMPDNQYCRLLKPLHKLTTLLDTSRSNGPINQNQHKFISNILLNSKQFVYCLDNLYCSKCGQIALIVYFDEMLVIGDSQLVINLLERNSVWFNDCGEITDGKSQTFCSVTIERSGDKFLLNQQDLIDHMNEEYLQKNSSNPKSDKFSLNQQELVEQRNRKYPKTKYSIQNNSSNPKKEFILSDHGEYIPKLSTLQLIEMLSVVATRTRPDLMSSVHFLTLNRQNPIEELWQNAEKILEYLVYNKTRKLCLKINKDSNKLLTIWTDASFGAETVNKNTNNDGRCVAGVIAKWYGCTILWQSLKEWMASRGVVDAELYSMFYGVNSGMALARRIEQFEKPDKNQNQKFKLLNDNTCAIRLVINELTEDYMRLNMEMYGEVKRKYDEGLFEIEFVPGEDNLADCLTKPIKKANNNMGRIMNDQPGVINVADESNTENTSQSEETNVSSNPRPKQNKIHK